MTNTHIKSFIHLTKLKYSEKALPLLEKIASLVKPIMNKYGWVLPVLAEFLPDNPSLLGLNVNGGQKILIRLRPQHAQDTFLDLDDLIGTMLHELAHNVHGSHDAKFYAFLKGLTDEFDALQASGYTGEGFHSTGHRFGTSHNLPPHLAKLKALAAAEDRAKKARIMGPGGRLGGAVTVGKSMRELALEAAKQRLKDDKTCGSGPDFDKTTEVIRVQREGTVVPNTPSSPHISFPPPAHSPPSASSTSPINLDVSAPSDSNGSTPSTEPGVLNVGSNDPKKEKELDKEIITIEDSDEDENPPISTKSILPPHSTQTEQTTLSDDERPRPTPDRPDPEPKPQRQPRLQADGSQKSRIEIKTQQETQAQWPCPACTFLNSQILPSCEMCETPRSGSYPYHQPQLQTMPGSSDVEAEGWYCITCGAGPIELNWWCCTNPGCSGVRGWS
ncbi:wlm-domain-containing protein [Phaffia rhodozyma]|uniref:Wlm-domain-containing protein n=1 Tax=Phaffia rhodozyma TaxID=264483 RepID=A0A0F7SER8_PHARH|nr:wlm-domain-containing protein [Phaffia rhodozyma]